MKRTLWLSTSVLALVCCGAAQAQTASTTSGSSSTSADNSGGVEQVVVTAERRKTELMKTNISATVLTAQDLAAKGVNVVDQLQFVAPSVTIDNFGQGDDFDIRGIGKGEHNSQTTPGVITYRDGVPTFPGYITEEPYYDVSNLEILRGPQGTFAGQGAIGGAVFVTTQNPVIGGGMDGFIQAQAGNYYDFGLQGATNLPIDDTMAGRIAFFGETRSSFYDITQPDGSKYNGNPGDAHWGAIRGSLLWQPRQSLTVLFKLDADLLDNGAYPADPFSDRFKTIGGLPNPNYTDLFHITANTGQGAQDEFVRSSVKIDYVLPADITLQSISAFQYGNTAYKADLYGPLACANVTCSGSNPYYVANVGWSFGDNVDETIWSEEVNLISSDSGWFNWVLGGFAQSNEYDFLSPEARNFVINQVPGPGVYSLQGSNPETDVSAFGQATFKLPAGFEIQLGGRYANDTTQNKNVNIDQYGLELADNQTIAWNNFSYKASLDWTINEENYLYGFMATGYKPGGLNVPVGLGTPASFGAETVVNYEAGWKASFFDGHLLSQLDGYWNNFHSFQVIIGYPAIPVFGFEVNDPNTTKLYGIEESLQAAFGNWTFDGNLGLMHSSLGTFWATDPRIASGYPCNPNTGPANPLNSCVNLGGHPQTYAPNFSANFSVFYKFLLEGGDTLTPGVNFGYESGQWATLFDNPELGDHLSERHILGGQLSWVRGSYTLTAYGSNLLDQHYVEALNSDLDFAGPPREFGIRLSKTF
ncbi:MAG: TonB-dependent receptor plug domain-containing protein [Rhizomicrobium sp.]